VIETANLRLIPYAPSQLLTLIGHPERFADVSEYPAAAGLREFFVSGEVSAAWLANLRALRLPDPWTLGFAVVHRDQRQVVGSAGFKGAPDGDGVVEIAYGIVPSFEGRGYATETARALVTYACGSGLVYRVRAHTLPTNNASTRVLTKCGFQRIGDVVDPDDGPVWRWERGADTSSSLGASINA
jgi:RimJ/RimL family protein N-acetyltransferase